jgi:hypothetical protein
VLVLGKTTDDKGAQLEKLTQALLSAKQYRNICRNWIGPGGEEIDVRAEYTIPTFTEKRTIKIICECKAYKTAVDMTHWLKFCGKVYVEQQTQGADARGSFIALSGVNGNVRGNYDELKRHDANVELIAGDDLLDLIRHVYPLADLKNVLEGVKKVTDRVSRGNEAIYYDERLYWLILFEHDAYTLLKGNGEPLRGYEVARLQPMIEATLSAKQYVDLEAEAQAKQQACAAETALIGYLMVSGGKASLATIVGKNEALTRQELEKAAERLLREHVIEGDAPGELRLPDDGDYKRIAALYRVLFRAPFPIDAIGCAWYDDHIDPCLLEEIRQVQAGLPLSGEDAETAIKFLRLSPHALAYALQPVEVIVQHRTGAQEALVIPEVDSMDRDSFLKLLCDSLQRDFSHPGLAKYFYDLRGMREFEIAGTYTAKTHAAVAVRLEIRQRLMLAPFEPLKGHPLLVVARNDLPEPWEGIRPPAPDIAPPKQTG